ncbi:MAG TPA: glycosyltransferase [Candidatus Saccharimonadales bacterium]|nr:glycosyltransferase [Candidatus Saccharimonadales bacterium]
MKKPAVSIIVPIYNTVGYIEACLESIFSQTFGDYELILVDDGSDDGSGDYCDEIVRLHENVRVIHTENLGVSSARNTGITHANGQYICFVDSDDYLEPNFVEKLIAVARSQDADIVSCGFSKIYQQGNREHLLCKEGTYENEGAVKRLLLSTELAEVVIWNKLYRHNLFTENRIRFPEDKRYSEDVAINFELYTAARRTVFIKDLLYNYVQRESAATKQGYTPALFDAVDVAQNISKRVLSRWPDMKSLTYRFELRYIFLLAGIICESYASNRGALGRLSVWVRKNVLGILFSRHVPVFHKLRAVMLALGTNEYYSASRTLRQLVGMQRRLVYKKIHEKSRNGNRRILILTQPLGLNYGGMLQAYALQRVIGELGFDVTTNNHKKHASLELRLLRFAKACLGRRKHLAFVIGDAEHAIITSRTQDFIKAYIKTTDIQKGAKIDSSIADSYYAVIVGSDQVWRKDYSDIPIHLLSFVRNSTTKRLSYAASFGLDNIDGYGARLRKKSKQLASCFDAISVREESGVAICKNMWGVEAARVLDPTLLLQASHYRKLVESETRSSRSENAIDGGVYYYLLDLASDKKKIINHITTQLGKGSFGIVTKYPRTQAEFYQCPEKYILPSVSQWLDSFDRAGFVVTDSFHGVVYSILFNKPFVAIGNKRRGMARFESLLGLFQLEDRLVTSPKEVTTQLIRASIDWDRVNSIVEFEQKRSVEYLQLHLKPVRQNHDQ